MFFAHDLIRIGGDVVLAVLRVTPSALVTLDRSSPLNWPEVYRIDEAVEFVESGAWSVDAGPAPLLTLDRELSEKQRGKRDADWRMIEGIVADPGIFSKKTRTRLIEGAAELHDSTETTVRKLVRLYFHGGMSKAALVAEWHKSGAPGVRRTPGTKKRGRPVSNGHPEGPNVDMVDRRLFALAISATWRKEERHDLKSAYSYYIGRYASVADPAAETGRVLVERLRETGPPSFRQFLYWARLDNDWEKLSSDRASPRVHNMTRRPLLGTSTAEAFGPCSLFQIDATILNVYVRSRLNRHHLVGRPTLYVVIDVFSRMIVGISLTFEHASWLAAMTALANCVEDKVAFCARHGVEIGPGRWPTHHLPGVLLGDRGELEGNGVSNMLKLFNVDVQNAAAYRADWKGVVERRFGILDALFAPYTPGYVEPDFLQRGADDYRGEAVLDLDEVWANVIDVVMYYNCFHELQGYPRHPGQVEDGVASVPLELWNWGVENRSGSPRVPDFERLHFALMPVADAIVTVHGIVFEGRYYDCAMALRENWFTRARDGRFKVEVSYDKRDVDRIFVHDKRSPSGFALATLNERSLEHLGGNGWESNGLRRAAAKLSASRRTEQALARADVEIRMDERGRSARAEFDALGDPGSVPSQVADMRDRRALETSVDRVADVAAFRPDGGRPKSTPGADVVDLGARRGRDAARTGVSMRDLRKALEREDGDEA